MPASDHSPLPHAGMLAWVHLTHGHQDQWQMISAAARHILGVQALASPCWLSSKIAETAVAQNPIGASRQNALPERLPPVHGGHLRGQRRVWPISPMPPVRLRLLPAQTGFADSSCGERRDMAAARARRDIPRVSVSPWWPLILSHQRKCPAPTQTPSGSSCC